MSSIISPILAILLIFKQIQSTIVAVGTLPLPNCEIYQFDMLINSESAQYVCSYENSVPGAPITYFGSINMRTKQFTNQVQSSYFKKRATNFKIIPGGSGCLLGGERGIGIFDCQTLNTIKAIQDDTMEINSAGYIQHTTFLGYMDFGNGHFFIYDYATDLSYDREDEIIPIQATAQLHRSETPFLLFGGKTDGVNRIDYTNLNVENVILSPKSGTFPPVKEIPVIPPFTADGIGLINQIWHRRVVAITESITSGNIFWSISYGHFYEGNDVEGINIDDFKVGEGWIVNMIPHRGSHFIIYNEFGHMKYTFDPTNPNPLLRLTFQGGDGRYGVYDYRKKQVLYRTELTEESAYYAAYFPETYTLALNKIIINETFYTAPNGQDPILSKPKPTPILEFFELPGVTSCDINLVPDCLECRFEDNYCTKCGNGKRVQDGKCVNACVSARYFNQYHNECFPFHCRTGQSVHRRECQTFCPEGMWIEDQGCVTDCTGERVRDYNGTCPFVCDSNHFLDTDKRNCVGRCSPGSYAFRGNCTEFFRVPAGSGVNWDDQNSTQECAYDNCRNCTFNRKLCWDEGFEGGIASIKTMQDFTYKSERVSNPPIQVSATFLSIFLEGTGSLFESNIQVKNDLAVLRLLQVRFGAKPEAFLEEAGGALGLQDSSLNYLFKSKRTDNKFSYYKVLILPTDSTQILIRLIFYDLLWILKIIRIVLIRKIGKSKKINQNLLKIATKSKEIHFVLFNSFFPYVMFYSLRLMLFFQQENFSWISWMGVLRFWNIINLGLIIYDAFLYTYQALFQPLRLPEKITKKELKKRKEEEKHRKKNGIEDPRTIDLKKTLFYLKHHNMKLQQSMLKFASEQGMRSKLGRFAAWSLILKLWAHMIVVIFMNKGIYVFLGLMICLIIEMGLLVVCVLGLKRGLFADKAILIDKTIQSFLLMFFVLLIMMIYFSNSEQGVPQDLMTIFIVILVMFQNVYIGVNLIKTVIKLVKKIKSPVTFVSSEIEYVKGDENKIDLDKLENNENKLHIIESEKRPSLQVWDLEEPGNGKLKNDEAVKEEAKPEKDEWDLDEPRKNKIAVEPSKIVNKGSKNQKKKVKQSSSIVKFLLILEQSH